jgi:hypothetical protein
MAIGNQGLFGLLPMLALPKHRRTNFLADVFAAAGFARMWAEKAEAARVHDQKIGSDPKFWLQTKCTPTSSVNAKK